MRFSRPSTGARFASCGEPTIRRVRTTSIRSRSSTSNGRRKARPVDHNGGSGAQRVDVQACQPHLVRLTGRRAPSNNPPASIRRQDGSHQPPAGEQARSGTKEFHMPWSNQSGGGGPWGQRGGSGGPWGSGPQGGGGGFSGGPPD